MTMQCAKGGRCKGSHPLICEDHGCAFDTMKNQTPTADAIRLAVKLSGHGACERWWTTEYDSSGVCAGCLGDAATIDRELLLPQKHAALLLAQGVVDAEFRDTLTLIGAIDELREALNQIKT